MTDATPNAPRRAGYVLESEFHDALQLSRQTITALEKKFIVALQKERQKSTHRLNRAKSERLELLRKIKAFEDKPIVYQRITRHTPNVAFVLKSDYDKDMALSRVIISNMAAKQEAAIAQIITEYQDQASSCNTGESLAKALSDLEEQDFAYHIALDWERDENEKLRARLAHYEPEVDHHRVLRTPARPVTLSTTVVVRCPLLRYSFVDIRLVERAGEKQRIKSLLETEDVTTASCELLNPNVRMLGKIDNFSWTSQGQEHTRNCFVFSSSTDIERLWLADKQVTDDIIGSQHAGSNFPVATEADTTADPRRSSVLTGPDGCLNNEGRRQVIEVIAGVLHDTWTLGELSTQLAQAVERLAADSLVESEVSFAPVLPTVRHSSLLEDHSPTTDVSMIKSQEQLDMNDSAGSFPTEQLENVDMANWQSGAQLATRPVSREEDMYNNYEELTAATSDENEIHSNEQAEKEQETDAEDEDNFEDPLE